MVPRGGGSSDPLSHSSYSVALRAYILMPHCVPKRRRQRPPVVMSLLLLLQGASGHLLSPWDLLSSWKHLGPPNFTDTIKHARRKIVYSPRSSSPQQPPITLLGLIRPLKLSGYGLPGAQDPVAPPAFLKSHLWQSLSPWTAGLPVPCLIFTIAFNPSLPAVMSHLHPLPPPSRPSPSWGVLSSQELSVSVGHCNKSTQYVFGDGR